MNYSNFIYSLMKYKPAPTKIFFMKENTEIPENKCYRYMHKKKGNSFLMVQKKNIHKDKIYAI